MNVLEQKYNDGSTSRVERGKFNESPEREFWLHEYGAAAVQTPDAKMVEFLESQQPGGVTVLVNAVTVSCRHVRPRQLFALHALESLVSADKYSERPAPGRIVVDQLYVSQTAANTLKVQVTEKCNL